jgi:hypothetical protein
VVPPIHAGEFLCIPDLWSFMPARGTRAERATFCAFVHSMNSSSSVSFRVQLLLEGASDVLSQSEGHEDRMEDIDEAENEGEDFCVPVEETV